MVISSLHWGHVAQPPGVRVSVPWVFPGGPWRWTHGKRGCQGGQCASLGAELGHEGLA